MTQKRIMISVLTVFISVSLFAGNTEREVREVANFNKINVSSGLDVYLTQGSQCSVEIEATHNQMHRIITEVKDGTLHVHVKGSFRWGSKDVRKVYVSAPEYISILASSGADIHGTSVIKSEVLSLKSNGGADIYLSLETKTLKVSCSGGADILEVRYFAI